MLILGITTSTAQVGCAIGGHEGVLGAIHSARGRRHAETLTPAIEFLCRQSRVELSDIGAIAVDLGPGMFTGLRVGVAAGKALSHARRLPMIGVTSLDLLAFPLRHSSRRIVCALDAGRGEIFHASYRQSPGGVQRITSPQVASPDELASELQAAGEEVLLAGTAPCGTPPRSKPSDASSWRTAARRTRSPGRSCSWRTPAPSARSS